MVRWGKGSRVAVCQTPSPRQHFVKATTRVACASNKGAVKNGKRISAVALAHAFSGRPAAGVNVGCGISNHFELSKPSSDEGYFRGHNDVPIIVLFSGERSATTGARCDYLSKPAMEAQA